MEENGPERAIHPPHSPDLAPFDFYVFGHVKHCLRGASFETADELLWVIDAVLTGVRKWTCMWLFLIARRDSVDIDNAVTLNE
jgi:hypothetical protein